MNILEINYSDTYFKKAKDYNLPKKMVLLFKRLFIEIVKDFYFIGKHKTNKNVLVFYTSVNQFNSLKNVYANIDNAKCFGLNGKSQNRIPMGIGCFLSFLLAPKFIYQLFTKYRNEKQRVGYFLQNYFFIEGVSLWWKFYLKLFPPDCVILANDHNLWHRVLRFSANSVNIPTVYIQHASVSERFPKLEFSLALLEGNHALEKYNLKDNSSYNVLIGMTKFDDYYSMINQNSYLKKIGICTNIFDDQKDIENLCSMIRKKFKSLIIVLRPHPLDKRSDFFDSLLNKYNLSISDSKKVNSFDFLSNIDANIAGETSIHIESVLMNVYPLYFQLGHSFHDYYEYIKNQVVEEFHNIDTLSSKIDELLKHKPNIRSRAKYYIDTVDSENDGKSTELAIKAINKLLIKNTN